MKKQILKYLNNLDSMTYNHSVMVMMIAKEIEIYAGITDHKLMNAALLHDIGKLYIPHKILDKNGRLTKLERELVDLHAYIGYMILSDLSVDEDICRIVLYHHGFKPLHVRDVEYYDSSLIYQKACILRTIDSFEALTSDRSYHRGVTAEKALEILLDENNYNECAMEYLQTVVNDDCLEESVVRRSGKYPSLDDVNELLETMDL